MLYTLMDVSFTTTRIPRWPLVADDTLGMKEFNPGYGGPGGDGWCGGRWRRTDGLVLLQWHASCFPSAAAVRFCYRHWYMWS